MNNVLEIHGLCKDYPTFQLSDVAFDLPGGYIMGFIGPNGAGKTTTIKLILNIIKKRSGSVKLFGQETFDAQNGQVGVVMDAPSYVEEWTLGDVEAALSPFYSHWSHETYLGYLKRFGLNRKKKVKDLSRGMKVKLQIAVALSHDAKLLLLDEPTSGLDPVARDEICDLLREFASGEDKSVLFSTHISADLEKTADFITFIMDGRIVFSGEKDVLLEKYVRVTGGLGDLDKERRKLVIGYREHGTGFEGIAEAKHVGKLPGVLAEAATLDEIVIFMYKGVDIHE